MVITKALKARQEAEIVIDVDDKNDEDVVAILLAMKDVYGEYPELEGPERRVNYLLEVASALKLDALLYLLGGNVDALKSITTYLNHPIVLEEIDFSTMQTRTLELDKGVAYYG